MNKLLRTIFIFLLFFIISSCVFDRIDKRRLMIYNNSNKEIYNVISPNDSIYRLENYDDFVYKGNYIYTKEGDIKLFGFTSIKPKEKLPNNGGSTKWDVYFESINDKKVRLFIIKKDSVDKYGWKEILKNNIYNKKYLFTIEDLDKIKWEIEYKGE
jgi:hypothetical protein